MDFLVPYYSWLKVAHLFSLIAWMAGLFYLPRLFVYHCNVESGSQQDKTFQTMEDKLLRIIMRPAMIFTWIFGILLGLSTGVLLNWPLWFIVKFVAVFILSGFHGHLVKQKQLFAAGLNSKSEKYFRKINEVPTVILLIVLIMVVVRPF